MDDRGSDRPIDGGIAGWAERQAYEAERSALDSDQTASDSDQTSSDANQDAAEQDDSDAMSDQLASDHDQAAAERHRSLESDASEDAAYAADSKARKNGTVSRLANRIRRATTARLRAETAAERDRVAAERDEMARRRDARAEAIDERIAASDEPLAEKFERLRAMAAADRRRAAADRAAAALERARLEAELNTAHLDDLTGAYRRETGTLALTHEMERARRGDGLFVIAFVDVDDMKQVNDRQGHAAGDEVLKALVAHMRSNLRSFDPIVRYGGDEFIAGVGGVSLDEVGLRFAVIDLSVKSEVGVGISVGLAALGPDDTLDQLTARADVSLLDAKARRTAQQSDPGPVEDA
jgi:diguanylate cyclase (GGDEF)-like protein